MVGKFYQIPTFFVNNFLGAGLGVNKVSFSTRPYNRGAFSHFHIRDWEASKSKNHFCRRMELFTNILDCEASQYTQLECVKAPCFTNMQLLFSAAININRCVSKNAFGKLWVK